MTPEERRRAGRLVAAKIKEMGLSVPAFAGKAGVDPTTVRAMLKGERWPQQRTLDALTDALGLPEGEISRRVLGASSGGLEGYTSAALIAELHRRAIAGTL